jgi:hypothetical protein
VDHVVLLEVDCAAREKAEVESFERDERAVPFCDERYGEAVVMSYL